MIQTQSQRTFEQALAEFVARQTCAACNKPLGNGPRIHLRFRQFHPACVKEESNDKSST